jgi:O-antigen ligase
MGFLLSIGFHSLFLWKKNVKGWFALLFILLACLGAGAALGWSTLSARFLEFGASLKTLDGRLIAWHDMIPMLRRYALTGTGLGNFQWVFPAYQSDRLLYGWQHAHNDYLELAAELGVPAAAVLITSFLSLWGASLSQADRKDFSSFVLVLGGLAGAGSVALHGFSDFNFAIPANAMTFVLILGLVTRLLQFNRQKILIKKNYD